MSKKISYYLKQEKSEGSWIIQAFQSKVHTLIETIEIKDQAHAFEIFDKYESTPNEMSLYANVESGYYKEIKTVVGVGYTGVKSHIANAIYRELENGTRRLVSLYTECGSDRFGSGIRWGEDFAETIPTADNITCKKCQKVFAKMNK